MEVLEMQNDFEHFGNSTGFSPARFVRWSSMAANAEQAARILLCPEYSYEVQMAIAFTFLAIEMHA